MPMTWLLPRLHCRQCFNFLTPVNIYHLLAWEKGLLSALLLPARNLRSTSSVMCVLYGSALGSLKVYLAGQGDLCVVGVAQQLRLLLPQHQRLLNERRVVGLP